MIASEERRHLIDGPRPGEAPGGVGTVSVLARGTDACVLLDRCRAVLAVVLDHSGPEWPSLEQWESLLPAWFVAASGQERSREDAERWLAWWRTLSPSEKAKAESEKRWTLSNWLYWLTPSERQWFWWEAEVLRDGALRVVVEIPGWPAPLGALDWMLRASGAAAVIHEDWLA